MYTYVLYLPYVEVLCAETAKIKEYEQWVVF